MSSTAGVRPKVTSAPRVKKLAVIFLPLAARKRHRQIAKKARAAGQSHSERKKKSGAPRRKMSAVKPATTTTTNNQSDAAAAPKVLASSKKPNGKRKRLSTPERKERKRRRDRERRRKKKKSKTANALLAEANASSSSASVGESDAHPHIPTQLSAGSDGVHASLFSSSQNTTTETRSTHSSAFVMQPTLQKHLTKVTVQDTPEILQMEGNVIPTDATIQAETASFNRAQKRTGFDAWLEAEMKIMLTEQAEESFSLETDARVDQLREDLPRFRRAEEDEFLKEVSGKSMRCCEMNDRCESVRLSNELGVSPPIRLAAVKKGNFDFKVCIMCLRNMASAQLLRLRMDRTGMVREGVLQSHANYVDVHGEYRKVDCLAVRHDRWEGIALPIVQHRDTGYNPKQLAPPTDEPNAEPRRYWCQKEGYPVPECNVASPPPPSASSSVDGAYTSSSSSSSFSASSSFLLKAPQTSLG